MRAMILAAGKGERLRPLTLTRPKPLIEVGGVTLLGRWLTKLEQAGITEVVVNSAYLGEQIVDFCRHFKSSLNIVASQESEPLETGGALLQALPLLGTEPFLLINGDVFCDFDLKQWIENADRIIRPDVLAHFLLVPNPPHHLKGDFAFAHGRVERLSEGQGDTFTFSGLSIIDPKLISSFPDRRRIFALREAFYWAIANAGVTGEVFSGYWQDVGTLDRLNELEIYLRESV